MSPVTHDEAALARVFELLTQTHGVALRDPSAPSWMRERIASRLSELAAEAGEPLGTFVDGLSGQHPALTAISRELCVGETSFYRDPAQWASLASQMEVWGQSSRVFGLSTGCSTGQEAWTLRAGLAVSAPNSAVHVLGTDIQAASIETARAAFYDAADVARLPTAWRQQFVEQDDRMQPSQDLRRGVTFAVRDVLDGAPPGRYQVILCRNLLIYLGDKAVRDVVASLLRALTDDGLLVVARSDLGRLRAMGFRPAPDVIAAFSASD